MLRKAPRLLSLLLAVASVCLSIPAVADTGDAVTATLIILEPPPREEAGVAGGAGGVECEPFCAPPIPALYATQRADLVEDLDEDGNVDPGDTVRYTALIGNFAPIPMEEVRYFSLVDPHLELLPDSPRISVGAISPYDLEGLTAVAARIGTLLPKEWVVLSFEARVREDIQPGVLSLAGQGLVYSATTAPVLTDNPDTPLLQDACFLELGKPPPGTVAELPAGGPIPTPALLKAARIGPEPPEVLRVAEPGSEVEFAVAYANRGDTALEELWLVDVVGPYLSVQTESFLPRDARIWRVGGLEVVAARFPELSPGEVATLSYRVHVGYTVPAEVAYVATRAMAFASNCPTRYSDDPLTDLYADPTAVLMPFRCAGQGRWTWEEWKQVVSTAPTGLWPLVLQEKDGSQHLRWTLYGGDFFGDLSPHPALRPPYWPGWALVGLVEVPFDELPGQELGFRLAEREEPYVRDFLAEEPLFMWAEYDMPLYARVPATDAGELLWIDRFNRPFCQRGYLPLLGEVDWAHDWDMPWLEDDLIVATVAEEPGK